MKINNIQRSRLFLSKARHSNNKKPNGNTNIIRLGQFHSKKRLGFPHTPLKNISISAQDKSITNQEQISTFYNTLSVNQYKVLQTLTESKDFNAIKDNIYIDSQTSEYTLKIGKYEFPETEIILKDNKNKPQIGVTQSGYIHTYQHNDINKILPVQQDLAVYEAGLNKLENIGFPVNSLTLQFSPYKRSSGELVLGLMSSPDNKFNDVGKIKPNGNLLICEVKNDSLTPSDDDIASQQLQEQNDAFYKSLGEPIGLVNVLEGLDADTRSLQHVVQELNVELSKLPHTNLPLIKQTFDLWIKDMLHKILDSGKYSSGRFLVNNTQLFIDADNIAQSPTSIIKQFQNTSSPEARQEHRYTLAAVLRIRSTIWDYLQNVQKNYEPIPNNN